MGQQRLVEREYPDGEVEYFEGEKSEERLVQEVYPNGVVSYYKGAKGEEREVRWETVNGLWGDCVDEGEGDERCVRIPRMVHPNGREDHYEGQVENERLMWEEHADGRVVIYDEGELWKEGSTHRELADLPNCTREYIEQRIIASVTPLVEEEITMV